MLVNTVTKIFFHEALLCCGDRVMETEEKGSRRKDEEKDSSSKILCMLAGAQVNEDGSEYVHFLVPCELVVVRVARGKPC
jgi:hypothetical protein